MLPQFVQTPLSNPLSSHILHSLLVLASQKKRENTEIDFEVVSRLLSIQRKLFFFCLFKSTFYPMDSNVLT